MIDRELIARFWRPAPDPFLLGYESPVLLPRLGTAVAAWIQVPIVDRDNRMSLGSCGRHRGVLFAASPPFCRVLPEMEGEPRSQPLKSARRKPLIIVSQVGVTRFELVTSCSQGRRANQAALHPATSIRHPHRKRTRASWSRAGHVQAYVPTNRRDPQ